MDWWTNHGGCPVLHVGTFTYCKISNNCVTSYNDSLPIQTRYISLYLSREPSGLQISGLDITVNLMNIHVLSTTRVNSNVISHLQITSYNIKLNNYKVLR